MSLFKYLTIISNQISMILLNPKSSNFEHFDKFSAELLKKTITFFENVNIKNMENDLIEQNFNFMIRDFSKYAIQLYSKTSIKVIIGNLIL